MSWLSEVIHHAGEFAERAVAKGEALSSVEFWFNRYQTLIGVAAATVIALISAAPVWAQLRELKKQSDRGF